MRKFTKLLSRPADDWALVLQASASLLISHIGLYFLRFESLHRWATRASRTKQTLPISKLIWAATVGTRIMPNSTCLVRALATSRLLARNGYKSTLHIGVRRTDGEFEAHAWVEYEGRAIVDTGEALHFTRLCSWGKGHGRR
jgi:Transglutaminase-like superfamily